MRQKILALFITLTTFTVSAKDKVIVNPVHEFSNTGITHITKIELGKNETRLHIHSIYIPYWWVSFPKTTFIEDCYTGKRWEATGIINGEFDKEIYMPASGDSTFVLIFPPLDKTVTKINFCSNGATNTPEIYGISLNPKTKPLNREIPAEVSKWIDAELAKAKRKSLMDFEAGEFFATDTARIIGYIKGYDPRAGFSTGMIYVNNEIAGEDHPVIIQIHEDGRFESAIPMNYPRYLYALFIHSTTGFYIQPGQTLAMLLDWEDFLMANRLSNAPYTFKKNWYKGVTANINNELSAFQAQLPDLPYRKIYDGMKNKSHDEFKSFYNECLSDYSRTYHRLLETEKLSEASKTILRDDYQMMYATYLFEYEKSNIDSQISLEYYDFLQNIPMDRKELLSTQNFSTFINRLEFCQLFRKAQSKVYTSTNPEKTYTQYLFEELNIPKMREDETYLLKYDSLTIIIKSSDISTEAKEKFFKEYTTAWEKFRERHGQVHLENYTKKYINVIKQFTQAEIALEQWRIKDSIYTNVLKLKPGIIYDITKVHSLDFTFREQLKGNKEEAWNHLTTLTSNISEQFLKKEADRLFQKNFPAEQRTAYELPDSYEAKIFKELIEPFKGKILLVDFWATTCAPCVYNIKQNKTLREKYKDSPDVDFVFITADNESPLSAYNTFVNEQELIHTYRLTADQYRYMRQLFRFNGIPRYVLVDREGKIIDDDFSSNFFEMKLREM